MNGTRKVVVTLSFSDATSDSAQLEQIRGAARAAGARLAALQGTGAPPLVRVLDELAAQGDEPVVLIVVTDSIPRTGVSWVRRVASHWLRTRGGLAISCVTGLHRTRADVERALAGQGVRRVVSDASAPLRSTAWEQPPPLRHHVLVCRGPRCNAQGAEQVAEAFRAELSARGMLDDPVLLTQTACLFPCNRAPVVVVHPDNSWHGPVRSDDVAAFVESQLCGSPPAGRGVGHESASES